MEINRAVLIEPESPGFNFFSSVQMPLLGLPLLGAIMEKMGIEVRIFCENFSDLDWDQIREADIVGLSVLTVLAPRAYELAGKIKNINPSAPVIMGGVHVSMLPEEALENGADIVVRGEGENTIKKLIDGLRQEKSLEKIPGISYRREGNIIHNSPGGMTELDRLPAPDFSLIENYRDIPYIPYQTSRGCPHDCEFCSVVEMFGRKVRYRDSGQVISDLTEITSDPAQSEKNVFIVDDNFSARKGRAKTLLEDLKSSTLQLEWSTQEEVLVHKKEDILDLMAETGCKRLQLGIESLNPAALDEYDKPQRKSDIYKAVEKIKARGIAVHGMFVLGADSDTMKTIKETIQAALELDLETAQFFVLVPPPGTDFFQRIKENGRLLAEKISDWSFFDGQHVVFEPKNFSPAALQKAQIKAFKKFYSLKRSLKWLSRGRFREAGVSIYGFWAIRRWIRENREFIENLSEENKEVNC